MGVPEAAEYLGVVVRTVYRLIDTGEIRAYKVGRVIRMKRDDVDAFLNARQIQPGELGHLYPPLLGSEGVREGDG